MQLKSDVFRIVTLVLVRTLEVDPDSVLPQPTAVAMLPTYRFEESCGRQIAPIRFARFKLATENVVCRNVSHFTGLDCKINVYHQTGVSDNMYAYPQA